MFVVRNSAASNVLINLFMILLEFSPPSEILSAKKLTIKTKIKIRPNILKSSLYANMDMFHSL